MSRILSPQELLKIEARVKEKRRIMEEYRLQHNTCPNCGGQDIWRTTMAPIQLTNEYKDTSNDAKCSCGWRGKVDDLVGEKK